MGVAYSYCYQLMVIGSAYIQVDNQQAGTSAYVVAYVAQGVHSTLYILLAKTPPSYSSLSVDNGTLEMTLFYLLK